MSLEDGCVLSWGVGQEDGNVIPSTFDPSLHSLQGGRSPSLLPSQEEWGLGLAGPTQPLHLCLAAPPS